MPKKEYEYKIKLTEEQWAVMDEFMRKMIEGMEDVPNQFSDTRDHFFYPLAKVFIQMDIQAHKVLPDMCAPGSLGCVLERNIEAFKRKFPKEIAEDEGKPLTNNNQR